MEQRERKVSNTMAANNIGGNTTKLAIKNAIPTAIPINAMNLRSLSATGKIARDITESCG
jgi:hypothetical protein